MSIVIGLLMSLIFGGIIAQYINGSLPSIGLFLGWVLYIKWYSIFEDRKENIILKISHHLPELELQDAKKAR